MTPTEAAALRKLIIKFVTETILHEQDKANGHFSQTAALTAVELAGMAVNEFITSCTVNPPTTASSIRIVDSWNITAHSVVNDEVLVRFASAAAARQFATELETP